MKMKRLLWGFLMIAAVALAGCGGNGGSSATDPMNGNGMNGNGTPTAAELAVAAVIAELRAEGITISDNADQLTIVTAIQTLAARNPEDPEDPIIAQLRTTLGLGADATLDMILDEVKTLRPSGPAPNAHSMGITHAILGSNTPDNQTTYMGVGATTRPGNATDETVSARAGASATDTEPAIFVGDPASDFAAADQLNNVEMMTDPNDTTMMVPTPNQFMPMAGSEVRLAKGFTSTLHERMITNDDNETTTDKIAVIADMETSQDLSFLDYYTTEDRAGVDGAANLTPPTNPTDTLLGQVEINEAAVSTNSTLFSSSFFPVARNQTLDYVADDPNTTDINEEKNGGRTFEGSFNSIAGTFSCTGTTCTATNGDDNNLTTLVGAWTFAPTDEESLIPGVDYDSDFLAFGWWLRSTPHNADTPYAIGTFATGSTSYTVADAQRAALTGTARYSGPAAGQFSRKTLNVDGSVNTLMVGNFTADASLTATFSQTAENDIVPNQLYSISGSVSDFRDADDNMIDAGWTVDLMKAGFGTDTSNNPRDSDFTDDATFGGNTSGNGEWQAQFFGPSTGPDGPDSDTNPDPVMPTGVAGEFTNHWANGNVIGAFGATKDE